MIGDEEMMIRKGEMVCVCICIRSEACNFCNGVVIELALWGKL